MIVNSKYNNDFELKKNFHQFVLVDNQDISIVKEEIKQHFFIDYIEYIFYIFGMLIIILKQMYKSNVKIIDC